MKYIDLHCDTIMECFLKGLNLRENTLHLDLLRSADAGLLVQCMAIFIPTNEIAEEYSIKLKPYDYFHACLEVYNHELDTNKDLIAPALCYQDIIDNTNKGKISSVLAIEDGVIVDGKLSRIKEFFDLGVRLITLTWNYENCFGFPQSTDPEAMKLDLKPFGLEAVQYMNELGIIIDVSHLSEGGFDDVAMHSRKPFMASHSCCRALCDVSRNLTDRQLKVLGDKGSVCGINFAPHFIKEGSTHTKINAVVNHMRHIADLAGIEAVAFGSDFDGIPGELEFKDCSGMPLIIDALSGAFHEREVEMICKDNVLRLFRENF